MLLSSLGEAGYSPDMDLRKFRGGLNMGTGFGLGFRV